MLKVFQFLVHLFGHLEQNWSVYTLRRQGLLPTLECLFSPYFTLLPCGSSNSFIIILSLVLQICRLIISRIFHFSVRNFFPRTQCFLFLNLWLLFSCYCCDIWCYCWLFSAVCVCSCILNGFCADMLELHNLCFCSSFSWSLWIVSKGCGSQPLIRAWVQHTKEHKMLLFIVPVWLLPRVCSCLLYIFYVYTCNIFFFWHLSNMNKRQQAAKGCFFPIIALLLWNDSWSWLMLLYAIGSNEAARKYCLKRHCLHQVVVLRNTYFFLTVT